ncbi:peptidase S16 [Nanobdella aerobiophila]|uniref:Peptidase S16 n=1 Tax=Nanobdella aerobiophila TaxID=2586965 RepID=A0A915SAE9_9ARCH|nr:hypothetical protein [Nanobdella aerobiophila]BBL45712.1 peptidase S16 [Nanobdella aerobiophila]
MKFKFGYISKIIIAVIGLLVILSLLVYIVSFRYIYYNSSSIYSVYIPAVLNNSNNLSGEITQFSLYVSNGDGTVYESVPPIFQQPYNLAYLYAKDAYCSIDPINCNNYNYYFSSNDVLFADGFSGTAGLTLLVLEALNNETPIVNYPVTGFMLPNGLIAPVAGISYKLNATLQYFPYLVAPYYNNSNIIPISTILDLENVYFNYTINETYSPPASYTSTIKNIESQICSGINDTNVSYYISRGDYYTAASLCFESHVSSNNINISEAQVINDINSLYNNVTSYSCYGNYECKEIKYQVISRLEAANSSLNNISYSYWRYYSALGWSEFLPITQNINKNNECNLINQEYQLMQYTYQGQLPQNLSCFDEMNFLANIYYLYIANDTNYMNINTANNIEYLDYYYYNKYGFSITSYNYLQFGKDLIEMNQTESGFYYLILSIEYAI